MNETEAPVAGGNPFTARTALALVLFGSLVFVALLWMIGNGFAEGSANDGGGHAEGRGLNGYAALSDLLERRGHPSHHTRTKAAFSDAGLLVLTPSVQAKARDIDAAILRHRRIGPTLLILPKWYATAIPPQMRPATKAKAGWTMLIGSGPPPWAENLTSFGKLDVRVDKVRRGTWSGLGLAGRLPGEVQQTLGSGSVATLVGDRQHQTLAGYRDDGSASATLTGVDEDNEGDTSLYPLVVVAEPDLLDNYGMADRERAMLALALVAALAVDPHAPVQFDLTLAGLGRDASLLTLAFTTPFLAATLCLLLAAGAVGWRAFLRFGPPQAPGRAIAFGKRALVSNAAGLIVRSRRYHLLGTPYAAAARQRLARAFALPRGADAAAELTALDRAGRIAGAGDHAFSQAAARLTQARNARDLVKAAADLHALERTLTR